LNVIVCYKLSPDAEDIQAKPDGTLNFANAEWKIGQYDLMAIEAGAQLVESQGGTLTALSVGPKELENSKARKGVLSRGPSELVVVMDEALRDADTHLTAQALAGAIRKRGACDLVVCGEGSADMYAQQVGAQLGQLLGLPTLNAVGKITPSGDKLIVERVLEDEVEVLEVSLPAALSVTTDINLPRIPGMKDILAAGKKTVTEWKLADVAPEGAHPTVEALSTLAPKQADRKKIIRQGESEDTVRALLADLHKEGVL
jgi:electron transfer flavoprotein beta subunit